MQEKHLKCASSFKLNIPYTLSSFKSIIYMYMPLLGEILKEKLKFYRKIMEQDDFQASEGWLKKFKKHFGIHVVLTPHKNIF